MLSNLAEVLEDYRQKLLNARVMLSLRRSLFDRLLHLPLPALWDMKTGGILSRLTGDVETTSGLLQMGHGAARHSRRDGDEPGVRSPFFLSAAAGSI